MSWVKVAWIPQLFAAFDAIAPARAKESDGTIGDTAHQGSASGHNPDDTPGSKPEREDSDNIAEVRAADVTTNLRSNVTMEQVVQRVLATPAERDRLIYIIYNRRIWRKSNGWRQETYTGSDPHDTHAHFSGDPASDTDSGAWHSITSFMEVDMGGEIADRILHDTIQVDNVTFSLWRRLAFGDDPLWTSLSGGTNAPSLESRAPGVSRANLTYLANKVEAIAAALTAIGSKVDIDPAELASITEASRVGVREAIGDFANEIVGKVVEQLGPELGAQVEQVVRGVFRDAGTE